MEQRMQVRYFVGIYARISVDRGGKTESIASQIAMAKEYLGQREEMALYGCYIDV